jgi:hypothetical protein
LPLSESYTVSVTPITFGPKLRKKRILKLIIKPCTPGKGRGGIAISVVIFLIKQVFYLQKQPYLLQVIIGPKIGSEILRD